MAINARTNRNTAILTQQRMRWIGAAFTTTGTSVNIDVSDFKVITGAFATYIGTPAASDGPLSINETLANDKLTLNTAKVLRVARPAGTTSGQQFNVLIIGY